MFNIAWGQDIGDDYEHITANISPLLEIATVAFFFTDNVATITDPESGTVLWQADGEPLDRRPPWAKA